MLVDAFNRKINYLRVSVTDRCNFKCAYCKPEEDFELFKREDLLSLEEIAEICRIFIQLGIDKIRLTGGEPLARKGIISLVNSLSRMEGLRDLALSTNGALLPGKEKELLSNGLKRINISLDTLRTERFKTMTKLDCLDSVLQGIDGCIQAGFQSVKVNVVLIRGFNDDELGDFLEFARQKPIDIRFIELMPSRSCFERSENQFFPNTEAKAILESMANLIPITHGSGVAKIYQIEKGLGKIGFISPLSTNFCHECNRLRLTSNGTLRLCLHAEKEVDLKAILRSPHYAEKDLSMAILDSLSLKPWKHKLGHLREGGATLKMSQVGG